MPLTVDANLSAPDEFYASLLALHRDLSPEDSALANARLILLLANHIGDIAVLREAIAAARAGVQPEVRHAAPAAADGDATREERVLERHRPEC